MTDHIKGGIIMHRSPKTIYQELRKQAEQDGITQEALSKTHNIKDIYRAYNASEDKNTNAGTIQDAIKKSSEDPYVPGLTIDVDIAADYPLFDKYVGDLQEDITIGDSFVKGTSKWVTGYEAFPGEEDGNFIALHITVDNSVENPYITVNGKELDPSDNILVKKIRDRQKDTLTIVATGKDYQPVTKVIRFNTLTFEDAPDSNS